MLPTSSGFLGSSSLRCPPLLSILNRDSTLSSLNEYLTWDRSMKPPPVGRELEACCVSAAKISFLAGGSWLRLGGGPPLRGVLLFFSSALTRATNSCGVWPCSWSCFQVLHSTTPIWTRIGVRKLWRHVSTSVSGVMPHRLLMASFRDRSIKSLTSSPSFYLVRRRVCMLMSASSSKKRLRNRAFKSSQQVIEPFGNLQNHSKATPFRVLINSRVRTGSFPIKLPICDWK